LRNVQWQIVNAYLGPEQQVHQFPNDSTEMKEECDNRGYDLCLPLERYGQLGEDKTFSLL